VNPYDSVSSQRARLLGLAAGPKEATTVAISRHTMQQAAGRSVEAAAARLPLQCCGGVEAHAPLQVRGHPQGRSPCSLGIGQ
jgi:hypothetical protein